MKKIALGVIAAASILTAVPAMAQVGFYAGPGGVRVGVGVPGPYYGPYYYGPPRPTPSCWRWSYYWNRWVWACGAPAYGYDFDFYRHHHHHDYDQ